MSELKGLSVVLKNLNKAISDIEFNTKEGLTEAALVVKHDSVKGTPIDLGNLRNSCFIMVTDSQTDNPVPLFRQEKTEGGMITDDIQRLISDHERCISEARGIVAEGKNKFNAIVGYTANYALWVHEMPSHYNFNSGSNKFLEKALLKNKNRILRILVKYAKLK